MPKSLLSVCLFILVVSGRGDAWAATYLWDADPNTAQNQNGSGTWVSGGADAVANWTEAGSQSAWQNGNNVATLGSLTAGVYSNNGVGGTITLGENITLNRIDKSNGTGVYIIEPGAGNFTLTLTGSSAGFGNNNATNQLLINASVGGTVGLLKFNSGTVTLAADNTWTGGTRIQAGMNVASNTSVLQIGNGGVTGTLGTGDVTFVNNAADAQSVLAFNRSDSVTLDQLLVSNTATGGNRGILRQAGSGTLIVTGNNADFTGSVDVAAGVLQVGDGGTVGHLDNVSGVTVASGAVYRVNRSDDLTLQPAISGAGSFEKAGANVLSISGTASTYSGDTIISDGTLQIVNDNALSTASRLNFTGAGVLDLNGFDQGFTSITVGNDLTGTVIGAGSTLSIVDSAVSLVLGGSAVSTTATLDMAGLGEFVFDSPLREFSVGGTFVVASGGSTTTSTGIVKLAGQNTIAASAVNVGGVNAGGGNHQNRGEMYLGESNQITAQNFNIGANVKTTGIVAFADTVVNGSVTLRGTNAEQRMNMTIGVHDSNGVIVGESLFDSTGGTLDARVGTLLIAVNNNRSRPALGRFKMGQGTLDATTIVLGRRVSAADNAGSPVGIFDLDGGEVKVQELILADKLDAVDSGTVNGVFNLLSGTLRAQSIRGGSGSTNVNRRLNWSSGTITTYDSSTDLSISDATIYLEDTASRLFEISAGRVAAVSSAIVNGTVAPTGTAFTKTGDGVLEFSGANTYSGSTDLQQGTLRVAANDTLSDNSTINFTGTATLDMQEFSDSIRDLKIANGTPSPITATVTGAGGTLIINGNQDLVLGGTVTGSNITLDMSGLGSFVYDNALRTVSLGSQNNLANNLLNITLAKVNSFTAATFGLGQVVSGATAGSNHATVHLGHTNTINANVINIGNLKSNTLLDYQSGLDPGASLKIRGTAGAETRASLNIGIGESGAIATNAVMDVTGGELDARVSTMTVGRNNNTGTQGTNTTGTFSMDTGVLDATTLILGQISNNSTNTTYQANGIFNMQGTGTAVIQSLIFSENTSTGAGIANGTFNLGGGGTLRAASIQRGAAPVGKGTSTFNWNSGTIQNYDASTDLEITDVSLTLNGTSAPRQFTADPSRHIHVRSTIVDGTESASEAFTKTGAGALYLYAANTYTGRTTVDTGMLVASNTLGSATGGGAVLVNAGGILAGTGRIAPLGTAGVNILGELAVGDPLLTGASTFTIDLSGTSGGFSAEGVLSIDLFSNAGGDNSANLSSSDRLLVEGNGSTDLTFSGILSLNSDQVLSLALGDRWQIVAWSDYAGTPDVNFSQILSNIDLGSEYKWSVEQDADGLYAVVSQVPEPGKVALLMLALAGLALRRRRTMPGSLN